MGQHLSHNQNPAQKWLTQNHAKNWKGGRTHLWLGLSRSTLQLPGFDCDSLVFFGSGRPQKETKPKGKMSVTKRGAPETPASLGWSFVAVLPWPRQAFGEYRTSNRKGSKRYPTCETARPKNRNPGSIAHYLAPLEALALASVWIVHPGPYFRGKRYNRPATPLTSEMPWEKKGHPFLIGWSTLKGNTSQKTGKQGSTGQLDYPPELSALGQKEG